jgi:hypothetical protein
MAAARLPDHLLRYPPYAYGHPPIPEARRNRPQIPPWDRRLKGPMRSGRLSKVRKAPEKKNRPHSNISNNRLYLGNCPLQTKKMQNILIADDHSIVRAGLKLLINNSIRDVSIDEAEDGEAVIKK